MNEKNIDIEKTAALASLALSDEEKAQFEKDMEQIVDFASTLCSLSAEGIEDTSKGCDGREDAALPFSQADELLNGAPSLFDSFITVPKIID